jgi:hypothetical protein
VIDEKTNMYEIESLGGPLICMERRLADQWRGNEGLSATPDALMTGAQTDYDCASFLMGRRYLAVLRLAHGAALVLGDRPMITGSWKNRFDQVIIWRVSFADPDDDEQSLLTSLPEEAFSNPVETVEFSFNSQDIIIFDSVWPGNEAKLQFVQFEITSGRYLVSTHVVRPVPTMELVLHRFCPVA